MAIDILELLEAKERRSLYQQQLCQKYKQTLLSITLNIPGSDKNPAYSQELLCWARDELKKNLPITFEVLKSENSGTEIFLLTTVIADEAKKIACRLEEAASYCRLLDIDVFDQDYKRVSNRTTGRTCFMCTQPAGVCMRQGKHSQVQLITYANELLADFAREHGLL